MAGDVAGGRIVADGAVGGGETSDGRAVTGGADVDGTVPEEAGEASEGRDAPAAGCAAADVGLGGAPLVLPPRLDGPLGAEGGAVADRPLKATGPPPPDAAAGPDGIALTDGGEAVFPPAAGARVTGTGAMAVADGDTM